MITMELPKGLKRGLLFNSLIGIGLLGSLLVLSMQVYASEYKIILPTASCVILFVVVYLSNWKGYTYFSYHLLILGCNALFLYMVVIGGGKFHAIYSIYMVGIIFTFIFFKRKSILVIYLVIFLVSQQIILFYSGGIGLGVTYDIVADSICLVIANLGVFMMCYFYLTNLEKAKLDLDLAASDYKTQQQELKERSNELSSYMESNVQLENYTHLAAHELRAPLKAVKGFADILKHRTIEKLDDKEKKMFSFISEKTEKMDVLLNDLATLGKVSQLKLALEYINLEDLFQDILIDRNDLVSSRNADLDFDINVKSMIGQEGLIKQLFSNLIANALKFVDKNEKPKVKVTVEESTDHLLFKVMDNGIGIKPEYRNKIFQIFERLHSESDFKGSGIGLSISKKIVDLHNGTIHVQDSDLGGACFVVRLPKLEL